MVDVSSATRGDLRLTRITKTYGDFTAVDDLSLTIPEGPSNAKNEPSGIVNERSSTAVKSPYVFVIRVSRKSPRTAEEASTTSCREPSGKPLPKLSLQQG